MKNSTKVIFSLLLTFVIVSLCSNNVQAKSNESIDVKVNKVIIDEYDYSNYLSNEVLSKYKDEGIEGVRELFKNFKNVEVDITEDFVDLDKSGNNQKKDSKFATPGLQYKTAKKTTYHKESSIGPAKGELEWNTTVTGSYTVDTNRHRIISANNPNFSVSLYQAGNKSFKYKAVTHSINSSNSVVTFYATYDLVVTKSYGPMNFRYEFLRQTDQASGGIMAMR